MFSLSDGLAMSFLPVLGTLRQNCIVGEHSSLSLLAMLVVLWKRS